MISGIKKSYFGAPDLQKPAWLILQLSVSKHWLANKRNFDAIVMPMNPSYFAPLPDYRAFVVEVIGKYLSRVMCHFDFVILILVIAKIFLCSSHEILVESFLVDQEVMKACHGLHSHHYSFVASQINCRLWICFVKFPAAFSTIRRPREKR